MDIGLEKNPPAPNQQNKKKKKKKNKKKNKENQENIAQPATNNNNTQNNTNEATKKDAPKINKAFAEDESLKEIAQSQKNMADKVAQEAQQREQPPKLNLGDDGAQAQKKLNELEEDDSEDEGIDDYKIGGYHPVHIGEVLIGRYVVIQKLGWGHFSTVWLCKDFKYDTYVAIKVQKSAPHYLEAAYDEIEILQKVARNATNPEWIQDLKQYYKHEGRTKFTKDDCHCVQLLNSFIFQGPYGNHFCMVFEIMGVNLLEVIKRYNYKGVPMPIARKIAKQILIGLDYLHRVCGVIHTDLKPENILLCLTKEEVRQVVEKGQLSRGKQYADRIKDYQIAHGIKVVDGPSQTTSKATNNANQVNENHDGGEEPEKKGKNHRKKMYKKRKREKEKKKAQENEQLKELGYDVENMDPEEREALVEQFLPKEQPNQPAPKEEEAEGKKEDEEVKAEEPAPGEDETKFSGMRGPKLNEDVRLKIVDLGNACWTHHHFTSKIQTRQYRSPEVIVGLHYNTSADIWSFACTIFEMLTGDFLFEPRKGHNFSKNDDHFAQVIELNKIFSKKYVMAGKNYKKFFDNYGNLRRIQGYHYWPLRDVLTDKYSMKPEEAKAFDSFIIPMLEYYPLKRISAQKALMHPWFNMPNNYEFKMGEQEYAEFMANKQAKQEQDGTEDHITYCESEDNDGDDEQEHDEEYEQLREENWYDVGHDHYGYKHVLNRSFDNGVYVGYADGIMTGELDQEANPQFREKKQPQNILPQGL